MQPVLNRRIIKLCREMFVRAFAPFLLKIMNCGLSMVRFSAGGHLQSITKAKVKSRCPPSPPTNKNGGQTRCRRSHVKALVDAARQSRILYGQIKTICDTGCGGCVHRHDCTSHGFWSRGLRCGQCCLRENGQHGRERASTSIKKDLSLSMVLKEDAHAAIQIRSTTAQGRNFPGNGFSATVQKQLDRPHLCRSVFG